LPLAAAGLVAVYLQVAAGRGAVWRVPGVPGGADDAAGLRAANARMRELLEERNARIAEQDAEISVLREHLAALQSQVADLAAPGAVQLAELVEAAVVGRAGQAGAEVAARQVRPQARPAEGAARRDDAAHGSSG
jgi:hypothetical protein